MRIKIGKWFLLRDSSAIRSWIPWKGWMCQGHAHIFYWWKYALEIGALKEGK